MIARQKIFEFINNWGPKRFLLSVFSSLARSKKQLAETYLRLILLLRENPLKFIAKIGNLLCSLTQFYIFIICFVLTDFLGFTSFIFYWKFMLSVDFIFLWTYKICNIFYSFFGGYKLICSVWNAITNTLINVKYTFILRNCMAHKMLGWTPKQFVFQ